MKFCPNAQCEISTLKHVNCESFQEFELYSRVPFRHLLLGEPLWHELIRLPVVSRVPVDPRHRDVHLLVVLHPEAPPVRTSNGVPLLVKQSHMTSIASGRRGTPKADDNIHLLAD